MPTRIQNHFVERLNHALEVCAVDPEVVAFKSIACYRTGLNIAVNPDLREIQQCLTGLMLRYEATKTLRLADKAINDHVVNAVLRVSGQCGKPGTQQRSKLLSLATGGTLYLLFEVADLCSIW